jgi:hypothetical protein
MIVRKTGNLFRLQQHRSAHLSEHSGDKYRVTLPVDGYQRTNEYGFVTVSPLSAAPIM